MYYIKQDLIKLPSFSGNLISSVPFHDDNDLRKYQFHPDSFLQSFMHFSYSVTTGHLQWSVKPMNAKYISF